MPDPLKFLDFDALLDRSLVDPGAVAELERRHLTEAAILVVDFTGMVQHTDTGGIITALARSRAARRAMQPAIEASGGSVLQQVADTFFAVFPSPPQALIGAFNAQRCNQAFNAKQDRAAIRACMGLGFGPCLLIPGEDIFGAEVNRAFVLGEDTANAGEVLATPAFLEALGALPEGVGAFEETTDRVHAVGFHYSQVKDYRL